MSAELAPPPNPFDAFVPTLAAPFGDRWVGHLIRRAGFGATLDQLDRFTNKPPAAALDWLFNYDPNDDPLNPLLDNLVGYLTPFQSVESTQGWWVFRMLNTPRPLQERIALFWHNHFATSASKVERPLLMHNQIELFRRQGLASFRDLTVAVGHDPAMLIWLDGRTNHKGKPNENYGRELMELFTLGIGNYTEHDVQEVARAFTGWVLEGDKARFIPRYWDDGEKQILGKTGKFDSESTIDQILSQPAAPKFLSFELLRDFVHPMPTPELVDHYAQRLVDHHWEIKAVLREMLSSRLFFSDWCYRSKIKSPATLVIASLLALGGKANAAFAQQQMAKMGQALLLPPTVKGWDGEEAWINANTVLQRFNFGLAVASARGGEYARRPDVLQYLQEHGLKTAEAIVDHFARVLFDGQPSLADRTRLIDFMNRDEKGIAKPFELSERTFNTRVRGVLHLMMATPEFQLA